MYLLQSMVCNIVKLMETFSLLARLCCIFIFLTRVPQKTNAHLVECLESDREALIDFRSGLKDPENWLSSWQGMNCCQWWGIGCDNKSGAVIIVDLHNPHRRHLPHNRYEFNGLRGKIRPALSKLKSLRYLDLSLNAFDEIHIPTFFGSFKKLQHLNIANAGFIGAIPSTLGNVSTLRYLDISSNSVYTSDKNLDWLTGLTSLVYLSLDEVDLSMVRTHWVRPLMLLPHLTELHLSNCGLPKSLFPQTIVNFSSLAVLDLSLNSLNTRFPKWIVNSSNLVFLNLTDSGLDGFLPLGLSELPNLQSLYLDHNILIVNSSEFFEGSWRRLIALSLTAQFISDCNLPSSVGNLTSLIYLSLSKNYLTGDIPLSIAKLGHLKVLDLSYNGLTGSLHEIVVDTEVCISRCPFPHLQKLDVSHNLLVGALPRCLGQLQNLIELRLDSNNFNGSIPESLGELKRLITLRLDRNQLTGTLPHTVGSLLQLSVLDLSSNTLTGVMSESHFSNLNKLKVLSLSLNNLVLKVHPNWVPPFQIEWLGMQSCLLGPSFPTWINSQQSVGYLDLSNTSISGNIPDLFWNITRNLFFLDLSSNQLKGQLPNQLKLGTFPVIDLSFNSFEGTIPLFPVDLRVLNLSNNKFKGSLSKNISKLMPNLLFLSLANNQLIGTIPASVGEMTELAVMNLSGNKLTGRIPVSIGNCYSLMVLDLQENKLSGRIPTSLGRLNGLETLHLIKNMISGEIPSSFKNFLNLETLDLGSNRLTGHIPSWIGSHLISLKILSLRSNEFYGELPSTITKMFSLQVLDLAENKLNGTIPRSLANLEAMTQQHDNLLDSIYGRDGVYYEESIVLTSKGSSRMYTRILYLLICIDLSGNYFNGEIPEEITKLAGLVVLNLSRNHITGHIPQGISELRQLESLDLSSNMLSGSIPPSMSALSFLGYLNLSDNNLAGEIPNKGQMGTFSSSSFEGNPGLCGPPLDVRCLADSPTRTHESSVDDHGEYSDQWFFLIVGLGFAGGLLVPFVILATRRSWSVVYFALVDKAADKLSYICYKMYRRFVDIIT